MSLSDLDISRIPQFQLIWFAEIETIWNEIEAVVNCNVDRIEALEGGSRLIKADYFDPVSSVLPTGASVTIDGNSGQDGDTVVFAGLTVGNNRVYALSGVGTSIAWTPVNLFGASSLLPDPEDGDSARIKSGEFFEDQIAVFDGTAWKINETVRYFNGADFWEVTALQTAVITDDSTDNVFTVTAAGSEHITVNYSIRRGASHETGMLLISQDGTEAAIADAFASPSGSGVSFSADINGADLELNYTADNQSTDGVMKYYLNRWSDSAGGPSGVPSYSQAGGILVDAAGNDSDIQFNSGGNLSADSRFQWDAAGGFLDLNGYKIFPLSADVIIQDNQTIQADIISWPEADKYGIIDYSMDRNGHNRVGMLIVANNGTITTISEEGSETGVTGVTFFARLDGGNVILGYTSNSLGSSGVMKYAIRRWTS